jgi:hypothetical protein
MGNILMFFNYVKKNKKFGQKLKIVPNIIFSGKSFLI